MSQKKFISLAAVATFLIALFTLEPYYSTSDYPLYVLDSYVVMGVLCVVAFLFLVFALLFSYLTEKFIVLVISTLVSGAAAIAFESVVYSFDIINCLLDAIPFIFSILVLTVLKEKNSACLAFSICVTVVYGIFAFYLYGLRIGINIILIGLFFTFFQKRVQKLAYLILFGVLSAVVLIALIIQFSDGADGYHSSIFFSSIVIILLGVAYFLSQFLSYGQKFITRFEAPQKQEDILAPVIYSKDILQKFENLQKLHDAGILTVEEFQREKEKILGGKKNV